MWSHDPVGCICGHEDAQQRRGPADRGECHEVAGVIAEAVTAGGDFFAEEYMMIGSAFGFYGLIVFLLVALSNW
jgi:hypothetical protein